MINHAWSPLDLKMSIIQRLENFIDQYSHELVSSNKILSTIIIFKEEDNIHPLRNQIEDLCQQNQQLFTSKDINFEYYTDLYLLDSLITHYIELNT